MPILALWYTLPLATAGVAAVFAAADSVPVHSGVQSTGKGPVCSAGSSSWSSPKRQSATTGSRPRVEGSAGHRRRRREVEGRTEADVTRLGILHLDALESPLPKQQIASTRTAIRRAGAAEPYAPWPFVYSGAPVVSKALMRPLMSPLVWLMSPTKTRPSATAGALSIESLY